MRFFQALPNANEAQIMGKQILRSASSTEVNCRARSKAEFYAKLSVTFEKA
ncbi:four helix bundle protein [Larkinella harenae]